MENSFAQVLWNSSTTGKHMVEADGNKSKPLATLVTWNKSISAWESNSASSSNGKEKSNNSTDTPLPFKMLTSTASVVFSVHGQWMQLR